MNIILSIFMLGWLASPFAACPEEVAQIPAEQAEWGYYHLDMTESMCGLSIYSGGVEYVYLYDAPDDGNFEVTWMGANMVWIDNQMMYPVDGVSYWVGWNGRYSQLFLPQIAK